MYGMSMVCLVDIAAGDVINIGFMHPRGPWKTFNSISVVNHGMFLWKTLFKRYQFLQYLLGNPAFAKLQ